MLTQREYFEAIKNCALRVAVAASTDADGIDLDKQQGQFMQVSIGFIGANKFVEASLEGLIHGDMISEEDGALLRVMHDDFATLQVQAFKRGIAALLEQDSE